MHHVRARSDDMETIAESAKNTEVDGHDGKGSELHGLSLFDFSVVHLSFVEYYERNFNKYLFTSEELFDQQLREMAFYMSCARATKEQSKARQIINIKILQSGKLRDIALEGARFN
jgi:hypothetical protein